MTTVNFELKKALEYSNGSGQEIEGSFIELSEPTGKIAHLVAILKSEIGASTKKSIEGIDLSGVEADDGKESTPEEVGESAFAMLTMGGADMERVVITFKEILRQSALVGGEKAMTLPMIDRMAYNDLEGCLKSYMGNFMQAS